MAVCLCLSHESSGAGDVTAICLCHTPLDLALRGLLTPLPRLQQCRGPEAAPPLWASWVPGPSRGGPDPWSPAGAEAIQTKVQPLANPKSICV